MNEMQRKLDKKDDNAKKRTQNMQDALDEYQSQVDGFEKEIKEYQLIIERLHQDLEESNVKKELLRQELHLQNNFNDKIQSDNLEIKKLLNVTNASINDYRVKRTRTCYTQTMNRNIHNVITQTVERDPIYSYINI